MAAGEPPVFRAQGGPAASIFRSLTRLKKGRNCAIPRGHCRRGKRWGGEIYDPDHINVDVNERSWLAINFLRSQGFMPNHVKRHTQDDGSGSYHFVWWQDEEVLDFLAGNP
jgi:hypothetical protein